MFSTCQYSAQRNSGFSLVEILVGMAIGMIGIVVILQVFTLTEGQKRSTMGAGDAQNTGVIALYALERDIRQSGYGLSSRSLLGCNVQLRAGVTLNSIAPTTINPPAIPAGDPNTDIVQVVYGNSDRVAEGDIITAQTATTYTIATLSNDYLNNPWVIATPLTRPAPCNLTLDQVTLPQAGSVVTVATGPGVLSMVNGTLFNLGARPRIAVYAIRNGNLTVCDYTVNDCSAVGQTGNPAVWSPIAENIVGMQAQYGRDTLPASPVPMDGIVDVYDQSTPNPASATLACDWVRVSVLRIALLARSGQYEKTSVTAAAPTWLGGAFNLSADANWQNYRYKAFQTVAPLRNITGPFNPTGTGVATGC